MKSNLERDRLQTLFFFHSLLVRRLALRWAVSPCWLSTDRIVPQGPKVPFGDVDLAATTAKLDAATARIASMEEELALLRSLNRDRLQALQSADVEGPTTV